MYKSITSTTESTYTIRGSRFLTYAYPVTSETEINEALELCGQAWPDATHHCYAWRIHPEQIREFTNDDGEPSGTAGLPILNEIKSFELVNILVIVIRYFGGTKLGKPGLIDAYRTSCRYCLKQAIIEEMYPVRRFSVTFPYSEQKVIDQLQYKYGLKKYHEDYQMEVTWKVSCSEEYSANLISELDHLKHRGIVYEDEGNHFEPLS